MGRRRRDRVKVNDATLTRDGKSEPLQPLKDFFSRGADGANLVGSGAIKPQLQWKWPAYRRGITIRRCWCRRMSSCSSSRATPATCTSMTRTCRGPRAPRRRKPQTAADQNYYQAHLRRTRFTSSRATSCAVVYPNDGGNAVVGSLFLYKAPFTDSVITYVIPNPAKVDTYWINYGWDEKSAKRSATEADQTCWFYNPGVLERTFKLSAVAKNYFSKDLLPGGEETITLKPGERITRTYRVSLGSTWHVRLSVEARAEGVFPPVHMVKFFLDDTTEGLRPRTLMLNGEWEQCIVTGKASASPFGEGVLLTSGVLHGSVNEPSGEAPLMGSAPSCPKTRSGPRSRCPTSPRTRMGIACG